MHPTATVSPAGDHFGELDVVAVAEFQQSAMAENTGVAYRSDWRQFTRWARLRDLTAMPASPGTVAAYLASMARLTNEKGEWLYAPSTLGRRLAAIAKAHQLAGLASPCRDPQVSTVLAGIRRERVRPTRRATPLLLADLRRALQQIELWQFPQAVIGRRDAALLLMGFAGAFRRSELTALTVADVALHPQDGLHLRMRRSKTDQEGRGAVKALPYGTNPDTCPHCIYLRWRQVLDAADTGGRVGILRTLRQRPVDVAPTGHLCRTMELPPDGDGQPKDRPLFRAVHKTGLPGTDPISGHVVGAVVKRRAAAAGLNAEHLSGHSLRAGFVTQAVRGGADAGGHHAADRPPLLGDGGAVPAGERTPARQRRHRIGALNHGTGPVVGHPDHRRADRCRRRHRCPDGSHQHPRGHQTAREGRRPRGVVFAACNGRPP